MTFFVQIWMTIDASFQSFIYNSDAYLPSLLAWAPHLASLSVIPKLIWPTVFKHVMCQASKDPWGMRGKTSCVFFFLHWNVATLRTRTSSWKSLLRHQRIITVHYTKTRGCVLLHQQRAVHECCCCVQTLFPSCEVLDTLPTQRVQHCSFQHHWQLQTSTSAASLACHEYDGACLHPSCWS